MFFSKLLRNWIKSHRTPRFESKLRRRWSPSIAAERLEDRIVPTTDITFAANVLTLTVTGAGETVDLSVTGTTLNVTSDVGTTAVGAAVTTLGFSAATGAGVLNDGSIAAVNDVRQIVIIGSAGAQTINLNGGIFTALTVTDGAEDVENVNFAVAGSTFSQISASAADANLNVFASSTLTQAAAASITTTNGGDITLTLGSGSITVNAAVSATGGNGDISITAEDNVTLNAAVSTVGTGTITLIAEPGGGAGNFFSDVGGTVTTANGSISITAADNVTLNDAVLAGGTGDVTIIAEPTTGASAAAGNFTSAGLGTVTTVDGDITIAAGDDIDVGAAVTAGGTGNVIIDADRAIDDIGNFANTAAGVITATGNNVTITATDVDLAGTISAVGGNVELRDRDTTAAGINLGTDGAVANAFGVTDAEVNLVTAALLRIADAVGGTGAITVTAAINSASTTTLSLVSGADVTQGANSLTVANLAVSAVTAVALGTVVNDVDNLAILTTADTGSVDFVDVDALNIATIDGVVGIETQDILETVALEAGGAITQSAGATLFTTFFALRGTGPVTLTDTGNDVIDLAANLTASGTGTLTYVDIDGALNIGLADGLSGITTNDSNVDVSTVQGDIRVLQSINAGAGSVTLAAGSVGAAVNSEIDVDAGGTGIIGTGGVTLEADNMEIEAAINSGTATTTLVPIQAGTLIDLGGADVGGAVNPGTLGLTETELDFVTAGSIVIGNSASGNISITSAIDADNTSQIELVTGGQVIDANVGLDITETRLGVTAVSGIGASAPNFQLDTSVSNLEATTATGGIFVDNSGGIDLNIGGVSAALDGVQATTSGNVEISNSDANIILAGGTAEDIRANAGNVRVQTFVSGDIETRNSSADAIDSNLGNVTIDAAGSVLLGSAATDDFGDVEANGNVVINAGADVIIDENTFVDAFGTGTIEITAGGNVSILASDGTAGARISTQGGDIAITTGAGGTLTVDSRTTDGNTIDSTVTAAADGDITINADVIIITANDLITAGTATVTIEQASAARAIDLGSTTDAAAAVELSDAELDRITASVLFIGDATNTGNITAIAAVSPGGTSTLSLRTAGAIVDGTAGEQADITETNLALRAGLGIGAANDLDVAVTNLAFSNLGGAVAIQNTGGLTINSVDGLTTSTNLGTSTVLTASGPVTFAVNTSSVGLLFATATDSAATGNDITVNSGVTVESTANSVFLFAGDNVNVAAGGAVTAATASIVINGDVGNADAGVGSTILLSGTVTALLSILTGGADDDTFRLGGGTVDVNISGDVELNGSGGTDSLTLDDTLDVTGDTVTIDSTVAGAGTIGAAAGDDFFAVGDSLTFMAMESVTINLGSGSDTVNVDPNTATEFTFDGNLPDTFPGDTLNYLSTGCIDLDLDIITKPGFADVNFSEFELVLTAGVGPVISTPDGLIVIVNGDQDFPNQDDEFRIALDVSGQLVTVTVNDDPDCIAFAFDKSAVYQINVNGLGGNDDLIVDSSNGLVFLAGGADGAGIRYDGGLGADILHLVQVGGDVQASDTYTPGPLPGDGSSLIVGASGTQSVTFSNLAPVVDNVAATTLTVQADATANSITYQQGSVAGSGLVAIDLQETIEFSNKTNLIINAGGGDDDITLDNADTPTGLTSIRVNAQGGDDTITTSAAGDETLTLDGGTGDDDISASGSASANVLIGSAGNDTLTGGTAADRLLGDDGAFLVDTANNLLRFDTSVPATSLSSVAITGLQAGENIVAIDFRPANGLLYGLGISGAGPFTGRLYTIALDTGVASQVGGVGALPFSTTLTGTSFGFDFNPTVDRIRVVSDTEENFRLNPNNGTLAGTDTPLTPPGNVVGSAYDRNFAGATLTTLFGIDSTTNSLVRQGGVDGTPSPNSGAITTIGGLTVNVDAVLGFDIEAISGTAFLAATVGGVNNLFTVNLTTGAATLVGTFGASAPRGLAVGVAGGNDVLNGGLGADMLLGGSGNDSLTGGQGVDILNGGAGTDTLSETLDANFNLTGSTLTIGAEAETLTSLEIVNLTGGASANTFTVGTLTPGVFTSVTANGEAGNDTFNITPSIDAVITVNGGPPSAPATPGDTLTLDLTGVINPQLHVTGLGDGFYTFANRQTMFFTSIETPAVLPPVPGFVGLVDDPENPGQQMLLVVGTTADDKIIFSTRLHGQQILVKLNKVNVGVFDHDNFGRIVVFGLTGNDRIQLDKHLGKTTELRGNEGNDSIYGGRGPDEIFGGDGDDYLDGRSGLDRISGDAGNDRLFGGVGHDILLGGTGDDSLSGGKDRDILIGGTGTDTLKGDGGDDILIGGTTTHDANELALQSILAEWTSGNDYATRVANLRAGLGQSNGFALDDGVTVLDDGAIDRLFGGSNQDWFFNFGDDLRDLKANELVN